MSMTPAELEANGKKPGAEGALWRLIKHWNPDGIGLWLKGEQLRATDIDHLAQALGNAMAAAVMGFGVNCEDARGAILGGPETKGVVHHFTAALQAKVNRHSGRVTEGGVFLPKPGDLH